MIDFTRVIGFDWDEGNALKNDKHGVTQAEAEEAFFGVPLIVTPDERHSQTEPRFRVLGRSTLGRHLTIIFTLRQKGSLIRVISARDMHRKERMIYARQA